MKKIKLPEHFDEQTSRFFVAFIRETSGDSALQVSMYDIGERIGLDRNESSRATENIMAEGWAEVRTLSGGIGITQKGIDAAATLGGGGRTGQSVISGLGSGALMEAGALQSVETVVAGLKLQTQCAGLGFEALAELVADLRTIDAQLASPRPKTAILKACFKSILGLLASAGITENLDSVKQLLV
ncbi:MAG: hypothetical protein V2B19_25230 [Pseudomonadota bacterium]